MNYKNLTVEMLSTFLTISDLGSISKASDELYIDQSSISRRIRQLENELNTTLFTRSNKGVELTESGKILFDFSKKLSFDLSVLSQRLSPTDTNLKALRIGTFDSIISHAYPEFFGREFLHLKQLLISNDTSKLIEAYNNRSLDAIIVDTDFEDEILLSQRISLFSEPHYVLYSINNPNNVFLENTIITGEMLKNMEIFLYPSTCPIHRKIISAYKNDSLPSIHQLEFSSSSISFVMQTNAVTILPKSVAITYVTKNVSKLGMRQLEAKFDRYISLFAQDKNIINVLLDEGLLEN